ncbi:MAG: hypothetical protein A2Z68_00380 [Candidatus Nealsonbacteria bacterium RBG_13_38_11]|uniref:Methyltransferase domain-containing protein n=1 Tax=Candidatus Nealsonbacteria bacterium RBG_13_38_11 TaxID=1801662 RepID=A0A1G2DY69_9BACT|nr:MAG: hypothetical protein A2Z68_00380 [Candidatus Nealsonbacteria bacterium RBG_13_38_11]
MQELNKLARDRGDWLGAAKKVVPQYLDHFVSFSRADQQFLWPTTKESRILDAGSMWGGITIPAAQYHKEVYAVDKTVETLEFLNIRAEQMNFHNIHTVAASLRNLPFSDNFFDLVILNGVLEWVALDEDVILEKQWKRAGRGLKLKQNKKYSENPTEMQLKVLQEINRVLKPGGSLYLAIENRIGYIYLAGWPDDHMNLPFICFMPRFLANFITKLFLHCQYRTYVYSISGCRSLLKKSGFPNTIFYGAFHHYNQPSEVIPLELISFLKKKIFTDKRWQLKFLSKLIPAGLLKYLSPSIICLASKSFKSDYKPRIKQIFQKAKLIRNNCPNFKAVKWDSRLGNNLPVNYLIYTDNSKIPTYFCKISRDKQSTDTLKTEAINLESIGLLLKGKELGLNIPRLVYYGTIDEITFLVTEYIQAEKSKFNFNSRLTSQNLKKLDKEINLAIEFLSKFQQYTVKRKVNAVQYLLSAIEEQKKKLEKNGLFTEEVKTLLNDLINDVKKFKRVSLSLSSIQGDFDFFYNIMFGKDGLKLFDFEHYESEGPPFLDFITLIFNPILVSYEYQKKGLSLIEILDKPNLKNYLKSWFAKYSELTGLPKEMLRLAPAIAALEQKTKNYPASRDPDSFPIYKQRAFNEMLSLKLNLL